MTGTYTIHMHEGPSDGNRNRWHALMSVCRSLAHDGLSYRAEVNLDAQTVTIRASGKAKKRRAKPALVLQPAPKGKPLTHEQCSKHLADAETEIEQVRHCFRAQMHEQTAEHWWRYNWRRMSEYFWTPEQRARRAKVGALVARVIAARRKRSMNGWHSPNPAEYALLDAEMGFRVERDSELSSHNRYKPYMVWFVARYASGQVRDCQHGHAPKAEPEAERTLEVTIFEQYALAKADVEFWRELELLSGQREHFKPGRTDETANADDEVAT